MEQWAKKGNPVVGIIVEPIQSEGGDFHGSNAWFQGLQNICRKHDIGYIMDEVQTGCGPTGRFWAHEYFNLESPPDIVPFSKKMLTGGFYHKAELRPKQPWRIFNTWVGDPSKVLLLDAVLRTIRQEDLLENTRVTGEVLLSGLMKLQRQFPGLLHSSRGLGTFCAVDAKDTATRDGVLKKLLAEGVNCGGCGTTAIRLRPALNFEPKHANIFLEKLETVLKTF